MDADVLAIITWEIGIVAVILSAVLGRLHVVQGRNGREVSELKGRLESMERLHEQQHERLHRDVETLHERILGLARTTDHVSGQMEGIQSGLSIIQEHLIMARPQPRPEARG